MWKAPSRTEAGREVDRLVVRPALGGEGGVGLGAVGAEHGVAGDHGPERRGDGVGPRPGGTASAAWPARSRATRAGTCSAESPRLLAAAAGAPLERTCGAAPSA